MKFFWFILTLNILMLYCLVLSCMHLYYQVKDHENDLDLDTTTGSALGNLRIITWVLIVFIFIVSAKAVVC